MDERTANTALADPIFDIEMLPAGKGDALWIEYGDRAAPSRVLIDCGLSATAGTLLARVAGGTKPHFELFVMTHIDADHIGGALPMLAHPDLDAEFDDVWFNGWKQINRYLSVRQGEEFSRAISARDLPWNRAFSPVQSDVTPSPVVVPQSDDPLPEVVLAGGMRLTLLSPTVPDLARLASRWGTQRSELQGRGLLRRARPEPVREPLTLDLQALAGRRLERDPSAPNGSSIALLAEYGDRAAIFTGDAHVGVLVSSLKKLIRQRGIAGRLRVDALKLSHHGSCHGLSKGLLDLLDCPRYLVSTNGDDHYHPDREAIARTILWGGERPTLYFNYCTDFNAYWGDFGLRERYGGYKAVYPRAFGEGVTLTLSEPAPSRAQEGIPL